MSGRDRKRVYCRASVINTGEGLMFRKAISRAFLPVSMDGKFVNILACVALVSGLAAGTQAQQEQTP